MQAALPVLEAGRLLAVVEAPAVPGGAGADQVAPDVAGLAGISRV